MCWSSGRYELNPLVLKNVMHCLNISTRTNMQLKFKHCPETPSSVLIYNWQSAFIWINRAHAVLPYSSLQARQLESLTFMESIIEFLITSSDNRQPDAANKAMIGGTNSLWLVSRLDRIVPNHCHICFEVSNELFYCVWDRVRLLQLNNC